MHSNKAIVLTHESLPLLLHVLDELWVPIKLKMILDVQGVELVTKFLILLYRFNVGTESVNFGQQRREKIGKLKGLLLH